MTLTTITQAEPWMTPDERDINQDLIGAITRYLTDASVPENALVVLRVNDIASTWLLARRLESVLTPTDSDPAPCPTPAQANAIGKCRERLCKAIKELEQYTAKHGKPAPQGLVERMHAAVNEVRASGLSTNVFSTIPEKEDLETESPALETPDSPNRPINIAPRAASSTSREINAQGQRRTSNAERRDKYRHGKNAQTAPAMRHDQCSGTGIPSMPPGCQPAQDSG